MSGKNEIDNLPTSPAIIPGVSQAVSFAGTSVQSATFQTKNEFGKPTSWLRLYATADCFIKRGGSSPTAAANTSMILPAGLVDYYELLPGDTKIAVIQSSAVGTLYITEAI